MSFNSWYRIRTIWLLRVLAVGLLAGSAGAEEPPLLTGKWKVLSVAPNDVVMLSGLRTIDFGITRTDFSDGEGMWSALPPSLKEAKESSRVSFDGPRKLNGGDISFRCAADLSFRNDLMHLKWTKWEYPKGSGEQDVSVEMWLEKLPDIERELQGNWSVVWSSVDGVVASSGNGERWKFSGRDLEVWAPQAVQPSTYRVTVRSDVFPIAFDRRAVRMEDDPLKFLIERGIVELKRDGKLMLAYTWVGGERPTEFVSRSGSKVTVLLLERGGRKERK